MDVKWKKLVFKVGIWIALEIAFSYVGVDTIADYGEYIFRSPHYHCNLFKRDLQQISVG